MPVRPAVPPGTHVSGVVPAGVAQPTTAAEVADVLRSTRGTVVPVGAGTKTGWAAPPTSCDLLLRTTGLDRVVEHAPGDLVVVTEAGVRLESLQRQLAEHGQMLALDPPEPGATIGGIIGANASGPRRLRYGTVRDLLIGVTVVLADGTTAKSGGKVVKNVAGYDLGKLYTGAHGGLGVVVSATWRLHPLPAAAGVVVVPVSDAAEAGRLAALLARSTLTPTAVEVRFEVAGAQAAGAPTGAPTTGAPTDAPPTGAPTTGSQAAGSPAVGSSAAGSRVTGELVVLFESIEASVDAQSRAALALLGGGTREQHPPSWFGQRPTGAIVLRLAFEPFALPHVLRALPDGASGTATACTGVAYAAVPETTDLAALRAAIRPYDGSAVVLAAADAARAGLDHWGPVPDSFGLMTRVKDQFDPRRRLSPGRLIGGL